MSNFCTFSQAKPNERDPFKIPAYPEYPKLRLGTQLDAIYERLYRDGYGIRKPGIFGRSPQSVGCFRSSMLVVQPFLANQSIAHRANRFHLVPRLCIF